MSSWTLVKEDYLVYLPPLSFCITLKKRKPGALLMIETKSGNKKKKCTILELCSTNRAWIDWDIKGVIGHPSFILATGDEQHLILMGNLDDPILVLDIETKKVMISDIKPPMRKFHYGESLRNEFREDLLLFGYVNNLWKSEEYSHTPTLPFYLIKLIAQWICLDKIRLSNTFNGSYWEIDVDQVLNQLR